MADLHDHSGFRLQIDDPGSPAARDMLAKHHAFMVATTPPENIFALDVAALQQPDITFWTLWKGIDLHGCAALRELDAGHGEIKSMHVADASRGSEASNVLVKYLLNEAGQRGYRRLSLETGSMDAFLPARKLYARHGFQECGRFAGYADDPLSTFMTRTIEAVEPRLGFQRVALGDVGSTNDEVRNRLDMVAQQPMVVTGTRQLSGRGRRGRDWVSPIGNVYASFAFIPSKPLVTLPELSFVASLAVCDMARSFVVDPAKVRCKWPNDVLLGGAKLSGILLETASVPPAYSVPSHGDNNARDNNARDNTAGGRHVVIAGIGINIASSPANTPYPATALELHSPSIGVEQAIKALSAHFGTWITRWQTHGFTLIRDAWLDRVDGLGRPVVARLPDTELHGRFAGLAEDGALMLETEGGDVVRIAAGDIFRPTET